MQAAITADPNRVEARLALAEIYGARPEHREMAIENHKAKEVIKNVISEIITNAAEDQAKEKEKKKEKTPSPDPRKEPTK